jgi:biopolymer transport protein ExbB
MNKKTTWLGALGTVLLSGYLQAQELAQAADEAAGGLPTMTLTDIMQRGGEIMKVLVLLSFLAVALVIFYVLTFRASLLYPKQFILEAQDAAEIGDVSTLRDLCRENNSTAAKIILASLEHCPDGSLLDYSRLRDAMEDEGGRQAALLWSRLQYLLDVSVVSPMVGLLGTVWGMMVSFSGLESGVSIINKADALASGVSQAMNTTFGGLIVGIFAMTAYDILRGRLTRLISSMESACNSVLQHLVPVGADNGRRPTR